MPKPISYAFVLFLFFSTQSIYALHSLPPDTIKGDTAKNIMIIYDTVKTEKIIYVYDTLVIYDTVIEYDVTYINKKSNFFVEVHGAANLTSRKIKSEKDTTETIKLKNASEKLKPAYSLGVDFIFRFKNLNLSSGLTYLEYQENANYNIINQTITQEEILEIEDNSYWQVEIIDTFYQIIGTDTTQIIVADSSWIADFDSTTTILYDTLFNNDGYNGINKYKYIELPLIIGKTIWHNDRFNIDLSVGMITGFLIKSTGRTILPPKKETIKDIGLTPIIKTNFYIYGGLKIDYAISDNVSITFLSGYRYMLNSLYNRKNVMSYKIDIMNFRLGVKYNL